MFMHSHRPFIFLRRSMPDGAPASPYPLPPTLLSQNRHYFTFIFAEPLDNSLHTQSFRVARNLGAILKVYVHLSKKRNNECEPP